MDLTYNSPPFLTILKGSLLHLQLGAVKLQPNHGAAARRRLGGNAVVEVPANALAQIQADAAGALVLPAIVPGITLFKNAGHILRRDSGRRIL